MSAALNTTYTIPNGGSVSTTGADLGETTLIGIVMPAAWTAANISFTVSSDGVTYQPLYRYGSDGTLAEVKLTSPAAAKNYRLDPLDFLGWRYVKVVSGLDGAATNQGAARTFTLVSNKVMW